MLLWTMQPIEIWHMIRETGTYRCDPNKTVMQKYVFDSKYKWLVREMEKRIGPPPAGVKYPVWAWCIILSNCLLNESEEEADRMDTYYDSLSEEEQKVFRDENWQEVFNLTPKKNSWMIRGENIQATVWELRKDMIRDVRFFVTGKYKRD